VTPVISTITPATGPTNGGTATTITGSNFQVGARVVIGALPAGNVVVQDSATITANTPGLPVGPADVTVNNPGGGTATTIGGFTYVLGTGPINYVQRGAAATASATTTIVGLMPSPQTAGNLNAVIIGWNDTVAAVSSVTDTEGNTYVPALPVVTGTALSQVIYYAKNIAGDGGTPNQITVTFNQAAQSPDVHILEYSGLDVSNPVDAVAAGFGSGLLADTGACTTTAAVEVVVAGVTTSSTVAGPGPGFNFLNLTANGDGAEHQITSVAGSCEATAPLNSTGSWGHANSHFQGALSGSTGLQPEHGPGQPDRNCRQPGFLHHFDDPGEWLQQRGYADVRCGQPANRRELRFCPQLGDTWGGSGDIRPHHHHFYGYASRGYYRDGYRNLRVSKPQHVGRPHH
jgi:hypothetical protein